MTERALSDTVPQWLTDMRAQADALVEQHEALAQLLRRSDTPSLDEFDAVFDAIRQHNDSLAAAEQGRIDWLASREATETDAAIDAEPEPVRHAWSELKESARRFRELSRTNLMALRRIDHFLGERIDFLLQRDESTPSLYTARGNESARGGGGRTLGDA